MAIPHSRSVHLLIDLLVADSVMELSSSDYHKQTGCLFFLHLFTVSFNTGHVELDKYICNLQMHCKHVNYVFF